MDIDDPVRFDLSGEIERIAHAVIGAAIEVHKQLGAGHQESTYEKAMCVQLKSQSVRFACQVPARVVFKGETVGEVRIVLIVGDCVIVELKAVEVLAPVHTAQVISYLRATGLQLALIINFNVDTLKKGVKRVILS